MSSKVLHIVCACVCCVFCVGIVLATISIIGSFEVHDDAENLAKVYALQYEDALQKYAGYATNTPATTPSDDTDKPAPPTSDTSDTPSTDAPDTDDGSGSETPDTEIPDTEEPGDDTDKPVDPPVTEDPSTDTDKPSGGDAQLDPSDKTDDGQTPSENPSGGSDTPPSTGGNGSSDDSPSGGELPGVKPGDSDEAKDPPESGTLPFYTEYCKRDPSGHWVYIVKRGDTLSRISGMLGFSVQELAEYNHIKNVNLIYTNQAIRLPCAAGCNCDCGCGCNGCDSCK